jgi:hypothetical protein
MTLAVTGLRTRAARLPSAELGDLLMSIDTSKVTGRRKVEYATLQNVLADAERLSAGDVKALGNWSPGQIFQHLATTMNASIDGMDFRAPWYFRLPARLMKKKMLRGPMPPGFQLPAAAARVLVPGPTTTEEGLAALRAAVARQQRESKRAPNPVLGVLTNAEWTRLHLIHAALHMSFLVPGSSDPLEGRQRRAWREAAVR